MKPGSSPEANEYCLDVPGTVHVAVASNDAGSGTGAAATFDTVATNSATVNVYILGGSCASGTNIVVITDNDTGAATREGFDIILD